MGKVFMRDMMGEHGLRDVVYNCHDVDRNDHGETTRYFVKFSDKPKPEDNFLSGFWELGSMHEFIGTADDLISMFESVIESIKVSASKIETAGGADADSHEHPNNR